jgi:hypothetical protein
MSTADRWIRVLLVTTAAILLFTNIVSGWMGVIVGLVAFGLLVSCITGFCPAYLPFHFSTARRSRKSPA